MRKWMDEREKGEKVRKDKMDEREKREKEIKIG